jgi:hypothetical protein
MNALAIATFILGILATPLYAQAQKTVTFNGMVFDTPSTPSSEAPQATAQPKTSRHAKKRAAHKGSAS